MPTKRRPRRVQLLIRPTRVTSDEYRSRDERRDRGVDDDRRGTVEPERQVLFVFVFGSERTAAASAARSHGRRQRDGEQGRAHP
jgi:hypothetical protein